MRLATAVRAPGSVSAAKCCVSANSGVSLAPGASGARQNLRDQRVERAEKQRPARSLRRNLRDDGEQRVELAGPVLGFAQMAGERGIELIKTVARGGEAVGKRAEFAPPYRRIVAAPRVAVHAMHGRGRQLVQALDDLLHRRGHVRGLGDGDLLDRVLVDRARRFELLQRIGAVDELGHGEFVAREIIVQQPADRGARVIGIKIVRLEAGQRMRRFLLRGIHLQLGVAVLEDLQREILACVGIVGFLDDLDAGGFFVGHQRLGHLHRHFARHGDVVEVPASPRALAAKDLEVNFLRHRRSSPPVGFG